MSQYLIAFAIIAGSAWLVVKFSRSECVADDPDCRDGDCEECVWFRTW